MNLKHLVAATAAAALLGGAAWAQQSTSQPGHTTQSGAHDQHTADQTPLTPSPGAAPTTEGAAVADPPSVAAGATTSTTTSTTASATAAGTPASVTTTMVTNGPVPDTPENRRKYGQPLSRAGKMTEPAGN